MPDYRRHRVPGGTYFFTVNLLERNSALLVAHVDALRDAVRMVPYVGEAQILTPAGPLPIAFEIDAASLGEAAEKFAQGAQAAMEDTMRELRQMQRDASSGIVIAEDMPAGYGGKIQLR